MKDSTLLMAYRENSTLHGREAESMRELYDISDTERARIRRANDPV